VYNKEFEEKHEWSDSDFVDSVSEQYSERGYLTDAQMQALENIRDMLLSR